MIDEPAALLPDSVPAILHTPEGSMAELSSLKPIERS
jgi:hypothetical protein